MKWMVLACILLVLMAGVGERTTHFDVKYSDAKAFTPGIGRTLEDAYRTVNDYFGDLPASIKVVVIDGDEMDNIGKHVEAFSAWNNRSSTIVLRGQTLKDKKSLTVVAEHEICHLALNDLLEKKGGRDFRWLEEGTCMVVSKEPLDEVKVDKYIVSNGFMSLPEIAKAIDDNDYNVCKNGYLQSYSLCKYIVARYGIATLVGLVRSPTQNFEAAFRQRTGRAFGPFYEAWKDSVREKAKGVPAANVVSIRGYLCLDEA